jgi:hypothetical protein
MASGAISWPDSKTMSVNCGGRFEIRPLESEAFGMISPGGGAVKPESGGRGGDRGSVAGVLRMGVERVACWERVAHAKGRRGEGAKGRRVGGDGGEGACRRTPCAGRAVMLTAVQSLRLLVRRWGGVRACGERGGWREG